MNDKKNPKKQDYKNIWKEFGEEYKIIGPSSRHTRRLIRNYMTGLKFKSIIDVGCGPGVLLSTLDLKNKEFSGIDLSESGIKYCKNKFEKGSFSVMDISTQTPKKKYDLAVCSEVLEHIKDDVKAMKNLRKVCNKLIITVPAGKYSQSDYEMGHYRRYSFKEMKLKLKKAGFKVLKHELWGYPFYSPFYRFFLDRTKVKQRTGKVTLFKRIVSETLYTLFFLNLKNHGDRLILLAE